MSKILKLYTDHGSCLLYTSKNALVDSLEEAVTENPKGKNIKKILNFEESTDYESNNYKKLKLRKIKKSKEKDGKERVQIQEILKVLLLNSTLQMTI